jgi:hypothetical protein
MSDPGNIDEGSNGSNPEGHLAFAQGPESADCVEEVCF